jgi:hypothetical protein
MRYLWLVEPFMLSAGSSGSTAGTDTVNSTLSITTTAGSEVTGNPWGFGSRAVPAANIYAGACGVGHLRAWTAGV